MARAVWYKLKNKIVRAKSASGSVTLNDADYKLVKRHLAKAHLPVVRDEVVPDVWRHWIVRANDSVLLDKLDPRLTHRVALVAQDLRHPIVCVSGRRTLAKQKALYAAWLAGTGNLAAKPGTSNHEKGLALDLYIDGVPLGSVKGARASMKKHGLVLGASGEAWHVELEETGSGWRA